MKYACYRIALLQLKGLGEHRDGLYYVVNSPLKQISLKLLSIGNKVLSQLFAIYRQNLFASIANKQVDFVI